MGTHTSLSARISDRSVLRYGFALLALVISCLVAVGLNPFIGRQGAYIVLFPAVVFSAWYCGVGPSILTTGLALLAGTYGFVPRVHPLLFPGTDQLLETLAFLISAGLVVVMGEGRRRENDLLRKSQGELEVRVQERTADLDAVNRNLRDLSARLLQLQDDERRRIARELHDSVGQMLAGLGMNLSTVRNDVEQLAHTLAALTDSETLVQEMSKEVRTISHLLHPPLLDEAGLASALRWYVDGFAQRSGIKVDLELPEDFERLPSEMETAIFRVMQECLTNIHRHSGSPVARIRVRRHDNEILADIEDQGRGIPPEKLQDMSTGAPGVGIRGMQERLRQLGGTLQIESNGKGTIVALRLPVVDTTAEEPVAVVNGPSSAAA